MTDLWTDDMLALRAAREKLTAAESDSYDPDAFPGSRKWMVNKAARDALGAFDVEHPAISAALEAERKQRDADWLAAKTAADPEWIWR